MSARTNYVIGAVVAVAAIGGTVLLVNWNANREAASSFANETTETEEGISVAEAVASIEATSPVEEAGLEELALSVESTGEAVIVEGEAETPAIDTAVVTAAADETAATVEAPVVPAEAQPE